MAAIRRRYGSVSFIMMIIFIMILTIDSVGLIPGSPLDSILRTLSVALYRGGASKEGILRPIPPESMLRMTCKHF